jgi:hypothetical protein
VVGFVFTALTQEIWLLSHKVCVRACVCGGGSGVFRGASASMAVCTYIEIKVETFYITQFKMNLKQAMT